MAAHLWTCAIHFRSTSHHCSADSCDLVGERVWLTTKGIPLVGRTESCLMALLDFIPSETQLTVLFGVKLPGTVQINPTFDVSNINPVPSSRLDINLQLLHAPVALQMFASVPHGLGDL